MYTYLFYVCQVRHITPRILFNQAFEEHYGRTGDTSHDLNMFAQTGELPVYVLNYLEKVRDRPSP